jgi:chaperonin cofactor prefoldin
MSRRARHKTEEIMMVPFLDILCSLIGVLVLIIVVLVVAQTQRINGRTPEELHLAQDYIRMQKLQKENAIKYSGLTEKLDKLAKVQAELKEKREAAEKLGIALKDAAMNSEKNRDISARLKKDLESLLIEIRGLAAQEPELRQKVKSLEEALAKMQGPQNKERSVVVNPQGSGLAAGSAIFFVDAAGDKLTYFWNEKEKFVVSAVPEVIVADVGFNAFLQAVKKVPQSKIIFLLREDGMRSYNLAAGWAQSQYEYPVAQIGKLPVPGRGELDMKLFGTLVGNLPVPPELKTAPPPASPPKPPAQPMQPAPAPATPAPPKP